MRNTATLLATCLILVGCQSRTIDNSTIVGPGLPVSYSADIQPIFNTSCSGSGCHINASTNGVRLDSYGSVMASRGSQYARLVVSPGDPGGSPLVDKIHPNPDFGRRMPDGRSPLSSRQISMIEKWIEDGAKDN
jgi:hypothetical protein